MYRKINFVVFRKSKFTQVVQAEVIKGSIASSVLTQYYDFLENSLSCGTFGLLSVGTTLSPELLLLHHL